LTPRELARGRDDSAELSALLQGAEPAALPGFSAAPVASGAAGGPAGSSPAPGPASAPAAASTPTSGTPAPQAAASPADVERHTATAKRFFTILDRDRDGSITDLEWRRSSSLRPKFEAAGADLSQPMSEEVFVSTFVKVAVQGTSG